jgi:hypothetical protein
MLNTWKLGGERVPFFCIVSCSRVDNNSWKWYFLRIIEEERLYSSHIFHNVKGISKKSSSFFVFSFEEKREEWPHLLVRFSPILGLHKSIPR